MRIPESLPREFFSSFHTASQWDLFAQCADCGGCEYTLVGSLLSGEVEYMADKLLMSPESFRTSYVDYIMVGKTHHEVLRLGPFCPFLEENGVCSVRSFKPVLCAIYPFTFATEGAHIVPQVDSWCPLSKVPQVVSQFRSAFEKIEALLGQIDPQWIKSLESYDPYMFDFSALNRSHPRSAEPLTIEVETLLNYEIDELPATQIADLYGRAAR